MQDVTAGLARRILRAKDSVTTWLTGGYGTPPTMSTFAFEGSKELAMGEVVQFPSRNERRLRDQATQLDRARRDWTVLSGYDRDAAAAAMTEFYRIWFHSAERHPDYRDEELVDDP